METQESTINQEDQRALAALVAEFESEELSVEREREVLAEVALIAARYMADPRLCE